MNTYKNWNQIQNYTAIVKRRYDLRSFITSKLIFLNPEIWIGNPEGNIKFLSCTFELKAVQVL